MRNSTRPSPWRTPPPWVRSGRRRPARAGAGYRADRLRDLIEHRRASGNDTTFTPRSATARAKTSPTPSVAPQHERPPAVALSKLLDHCSFPMRGPLLAPMPPGTVRDPAAAVYHVALPRFG